MKWVIILVALLVAIFVARQAGYGLKEFEPVRRFESNCIDAQCSNHHGKDLDEWLEHNKKDEVSVNYESAQALK